MSDAKKGPWIRRNRKKLIVLGAIAVFAGVQKFVRKAPSLENPSGTQALIDWLSAKDVRAKRLSIVLVDHGKTWQAHWNAQEDTRYELGSVSKALTGLVMADAESKGELRAQMKAQELGLEGVDGELGAITLESLATHHSGLPRMAMTWQGALRAYKWILFGSNPYAGDVQALIQDAKQGPFGEQSFEYSNLGASLLGQLVAKGVGLDYETMMNKRLFEPLGMKDSGIQVSKALVDPGTSARGGSHEPWVMNAYAPCGAAVSSPRDTATLLHALIDEKAPGLKALEPRADAFGDAKKIKIGYFWYRSKCPERFGADQEFIGHNGQTGGYASFVAFDPVRKRGVAMMAASAVELDALTVELICGKLLAQGDPAAL